MKCVFEKSAEPSPRKSQSGVVDGTTHRFGTRPVGFVSDKKSAFGATFFRVVRVIFSFGKRKKRHRCTLEQRTFQRTLKIVLQRNPVFSSGDFFGNVGGDLLLLSLQSRVQQTLSISTTYKTTQETRNFKISETKHKKYFYTVETNSFEL